MEAVIQGLVSTVELLLQHPDINVNLKDEYGDTALDIAKNSEYLRHLNIASLIEAHMSK
ncbi:hypothetical protein Aasi_0809 [Candidatus Amoebophilus asiaticus 5a2]|uniref:Ankyrin n=2 Tax=Candidatus Amoebophilus asiaticus TaxID=281120 RepID=B3ESI3_AMOA5|nr:hypothetical protein Aasi_0809 [Candidatus Amoebophilus asiaticus 5a2]